MVLDDDKTVRFLIELEREEDRCYVFVTVDTFEELKAVGMGFSVKTKIGDEYIQLLLDMS